MYRKIVTVTTTKELPPEEPRDKFKILKRLAEFVTLILTLIQYFFKKGPLS